MPALNAIPAGLPVLEDRYVLCCSQYGDHTRIPPQALYDEAFVDAVDVGYRDGVLHDCGHLAMERTTGKLLFLVCVTLTAQTRLPESEVQELAKAHGVTLELMQSQGHPYLPATQEITARLERVEQFPLAPRLTQAISDLEDKTLRAVAAAGR